MLLLMRRVSESIRINEEVLITVKQVHEDEVTFSIQGMEGATFSSASSVSEDESL